MIGEGLIKDCKRTMGEQGVDSEGAAKGSVLPREKYSRSLWKCDSDTASNKKGC